MKKLHLALSTHRLTETVEDYTKRLDSSPDLVIEGEYALWRTASLNVSVRVDSQCSPGQLRHLGWEDDGSTEMTDETDVNGIHWERFNAEQQADEINELWPEARYVPKD